MIWRHINLLGRYNFSEEYIIPTKVLSWFSSWNHDRVSKLANFLDDKERGDEPVDHEQLDIRMDPENG